MRTLLTVARGANKLLLRSDNDRVSISSGLSDDDATVQMSEMVDALLGLVRYERNSDDAPLRLFSQQELGYCGQSTLQASDKEVEISLTVQSEPTIRHQRYHEHADW